MVHLRILAVVFFLVGSALHTLAQVDAIARSKSNAWNSRLAILKEQWIAILSRDGWCLAIFILWLQGELVAVLAAAKIQLPPTALSILDLHVGSAIAFMAGYSLDSVLSFVPGLKSTLPAPLDAAAQSQIKSS